VLAPSPPIASRVSVAPAQGFVTGGARMLLRLEGFAAFAAAFAFYAQAGFSWPVAALFFLAPDLAMLAYLAGPRAGAIAYNLAHTYVLAVALTLAGFFGGVPAAAAGGLIWIAHIGFDRALGYGLKYPTGFGDSHLGRIGRH
jgi:Domain of unknown function (DUF4260)